jgi:hypothetical protein
MRNFTSIVFLTLFCLLSLTVCASQPSEQTALPPEAVPLEPGPVPKENTSDTSDAGDFDPTTISREVFDSTKVDVQQLIEDLNSIIRARDYQAWISHLHESYLENISSPGFLAEVSDSTRLKQQRIVLTSPEDYFIHVVVPSRFNDRVDDIEFTNQNRVKAYTITPGGQRLRLYELEKTGNSWKIMN